MFKPHTIAVRIHSPAGLRIVRFEVIGPDQYQQIGESMTPSEYEANLDYLADGRMVNPPPPQPALPVPPTDPETWGEEHGGIPPVRL